MRSSPSCGEPPLADQPHRARGVALAAGVGGQPVADLGPQVLPGEAHQRDRAQQLARRRRRRSQTARSSRRTSRHSAPAGRRGRRPRHTGRDPRPAHDLRVLAGGHQRGDVGVAPRSQGGRFVDERVAGEHDPPRRRCPPPPHGLTPARRSSAAISVATSAGVLRAQPAVGLPPASQRAHAPVAVLGGEIGQRMRPAAARAPLRRRQGSPGGRPGHRRAPRFPTAAAPRTRPAPGCGPPPARSAPRAGPTAPAWPPARGRPW